MSIRLLALFLLALGGLANAQEEEVRPNWESLHREIQILRERMAQKDREIAELQRQVGAGAIAHSEPSALDAELRRLRDALERESTEKAPPVEDVRIGGQLRWRFESRINYDFDDDVDDDIDFADQRARLNADFHVAEGLDAVLQFQDVRRWGEERGNQFGTTDDSADGEDLHQGYAKLDLGNDDSLRFGRMSIVLGKERLLGALDWSMSGRSFDGLHYQRQICDGVLDAFAFQLREGAPSTANMDAQFAGVNYRLHPLPEAKTSDLEFYTLFLNDDQRGTKQERWTVGSRWEQEYESGLFWELEGALQFGESRDATGSIDLPFGEVFAYHASLGYEWDALWAPRVWIEWNHASGDDGSPDGKNTRFHSLFPTAHRHNGYMDLTFWENTRNAALRVEVHPSSDVTLAWDNWYFAVDDVHDVIRGPAFSLPAAGGGARDAGLESDLTLRWNAPKGIMVYGGYSYLHPLAHIDHIVGQAEDAHWLFLMLGLDF